MTDRSTIPSLPLYETLRELRARGFTWDEIARLASLEAGREAAEARRAARRNKSADKENHP